MKVGGAAVKLSFGIVFMVATLAGCATKIAPQNHTIQPSKIPLSQFQTYDLRPLVVDHMEGDNGDRAAVARLDSEIRACLNSAFIGLKPQPSTDAPAGTALLVEPIVVDLKKVNVSERFWVGPLAGSSAMLLKLKLTDAGAKEIIAEPVFYGKSNAWGGAFTFAATDNAMLTRVVNDACNYARRNL